MSDSLVNNLQAGMCCVELGGHNLSRTVLHAFGKLVQDARQINVHDDVFVL